MGYWASDLGLAPSSFDGAAGRPLGFCPTFPERSTNFSGLSITAESEFEMTQSSNHSLTTDLVSAVFKEDGKLVDIKGQERHFRVLTPLSSSTCEVGFDGPISESFFDRLKEGLSHLPSGHEAQVIFERSLGKASEEIEELSLAGLRTKVYIIEKVSDVEGITLFQALEDLGARVTLGGREDYLALCSRMLGQRANRDSLLLPDIICEENHIKSSDRFVKVASMTDMPQASWNNCFESLYESSEEFICSIKINIPDKSKTRKGLETKRRVSHALSVRKAHELSDLESGSNLTASENILIRITQGKEALINFCLLVAMADDNLERLEKRIGAFVSEANSTTGAGFFTEGVGLLPVLRSHMPGAAALAVREMPILSRNFAHLFPLFLDFNREQKKGGLGFLSRCGEECHMNFFSENNLNFNAFVCGASGSGKSFLMNSCLMGFRKKHPDSEITVFDVGGSYRKFVANLGGTVIELDSNSATELIVATLKRINISNDGFCKTLLENICGSGTHITHSHTVAIEDLLSICKSAPFSLRLLSNEAAEKKEKPYQDICLWLRPYLHWDDVQCSSSVERALDDQVRAFDFKNLEGSPLLQRLSILILTQGIWKKLKDDSSKPSIIVFDEVWKFFSQASGFLEEMYRTFRKYRAGIVSVTQNLGDYGNDEFAKTVISNSYHRVLLQGAASNEALEQLLDMNESDRARFLSVASKKNEYSEFWLGTSTVSQILRLYPSKRLFELANTESISIKIEKEKDQ